MKEIEQSCYEMQQGKGLTGIYDIMAYAGRLTRNCEHKTGDGEDYVKRMMKLGHGRVFEFGTVYLKFVDDIAFTERETCDMLDKVEFYTKNPYSRVVIDRDEETGYRTFYVTTNYRVLLKGTDVKWGDSIKSGYANNRLADLAYMTPDNIPSSHHKLRRTIVWDYGISRVTAASFRTHCGLSTLMMSTRYCNYGLDKFERTVCFSRPYWLTNPNVISGFDYDDVAVDALYAENKITLGEYVYLSELVSSEKSYLLLTGHPKECKDEKYNKLAALAAERNEKGFSAETARGVLGLDVATKMIQCGYEDDWDEFFRQRADASEHPHPDALAIATKAKAIMGR